MQGGFLVFISANIAPLADGSPPLFDLSRALVRAFLAMTYAALLTSVGATVGSMILMAHLGSFHAAASATPEFDLPDSHSFHEKTALEMLDAYGMSWVWKWALCHCEQSCILPYCPEMFILKH